MPTLITGEVRVSVPASSANLGPGFDSLGLALDLRDEVRVSVADKLSIRVRGEGAETVPVDEGHLVHAAIATAFAEMDCPLPDVRMECSNRIPHARGLGSSSAAIVAGICAARGLVAGGSLLMDDEAVFALAARMEGHADNVAPAFHGGFTIAGKDRGRAFATSVAVDPRVGVVVFVPPDGVETTLARGLLPELVSHVDAAANAGRTALLVAALSRQPELLLAATEDRLHQDYREPAMPETLALVRRLRRDRIPAVVSGAGPSVLAFTDATNADSVRAEVPEGWAVLDPAIDTRGARVEVDGQLASR